MRMSLENLNAIRTWAIRNQDAIPDLTLRLIFATDLAKSVIEQEAAPDPQRVIEIGYDIANLMWRIRASCVAESPAADGRGGSLLAAGTRLILDAIRRGMTERAEITEYIEHNIGKTVYVAEVAGRDTDLDMPEFGFRPIAVTREDRAYVFEDTSETPCRTSRIKSLASSISKARQSK
ncbi:MAG: hypothetical protein AMJ59_13720 [Gammaproteobacteria bacterium SG8_31]|jgi:hypothetical protein|nr:MAG: hypothetical protein AMJ59_13720 [Gammaproteobacteria bacterium SG8_31]